MLQRRLKSLSPIRSSDGVGGGLGLSNVLLHVLYLSWVLLHSINHIEGAGVTARVFLATLREDVVFQALGALVSQGVHARLVLVVLEPLRLRGLVLAHGTLRVLPRPSS